jgi:hypothetical protein
VAQLRSTQDQSAEPAVGELIAGLAQ